MDVLGRVVVLCLAYGVFSSSSCVRPQILSKSSLSLPVLSKISRRVLHGVRNRQAKVGATWLESKASVEVPVPLEDCWGMWSRREAIPKWMPWVKSVIVDQNDQQV
ncbi:hypothetical protein AAMO2058_001659600, partial [Amorphochlora amoebiformis]